MMNRWLMSTLGALCAVGLAMAQPRIVINEFAYDDTGTDDVEFVELYNADDRTRGHFGMGFGKR
jgi:hypothetical protein